MGAAGAAERYKSLPPQRMTLLADGYRQKESTLKRWMMMGTKILVIDDDNEPNLHVLGLKYKFKF